MKTKIGERNVKKAMTLKGLLKAYPGAAVLAGLVLVGGVGIGAMTMADTSEQKVLENDTPAVVDEIKEEESKETETPAVEEEKEAETEESAETEKEEEAPAEETKEEEKEEATEEKPAEEAAKPSETTTPANSETTSTTNNSTGSAAETTTPAASTTTPAATTETPATTTPAVTTTTTAAVTTPAAATQKDTEKKTETTAATTETIKASSKSLAAKAKEHKSSVNNHTVGWIYVPNTNINYPVVQYTNNSYYAAKDYNKNYSKNGVIYADYECNTTNLSKNTILYGHNWTNCWNPIRKNNSNDVMFAQLASFHYLDVAQSTPFIYFSTTSKDYVWQVFAAFYTEATWTDYIYANPKDFASVIKSAKNRSLHDYDVDVSTSDKIISLSTCTRMYGNHNNQRFVVMAKQVPAGTASTKITANTDFKKPNC